jgi:hypothetical protein
MATAWMKMPGQWRTPMPRQAVFVSRFAGQAILKELEFN